AIAAIAGEPRLALQRAITLARLAGEHRRGRRHQRRRGKFGAGPRPQGPLAIAAAPPGLAAVAPETFAGEGLVHHAKRGITVARQPDQRAPDRQTGDEGPGAVDRIDDPAEFRRAVLVAEFLAMNAMGRE